MQFFLSFVNCNLVNSLPITIIQQICLWPAWYSVISTNFASTTYSSAFIVLTPGRYYCLQMHCLVFFLDAVAPPNTKTPLSELVSIT